VPCRGDTSLSSANLHTTNTEGPGAQAQPESPEQLLAMRFARGEIDEGEYQQRLVVLRSTGQR
jgi:uncharacterized membrane protein